MKFVASIDVMPLKALLDPQGKAVNNILKNNNYPYVDNVRIGKHITLELEADSFEDAEAMVDDVSRKVLINPVIEEFTFIVVEK